jgi:hypothetical protein
MAGIRRSAVEAAERELGCLVGAGWGGNAGYGVGGGSPEVRPGRSSLAQRLTIVRHGCASELLANDGNGVGGEGVGANLGSTG